MRVEQLRPVQYREIDETTYPVFFIGPIQGAGDWHDRGVEMVTEGVAKLSRKLGSKTIRRVETVLIISPARVRDLAGTAIKLVTPGHETRYVRQRPWEQEGMDEAGKKGTIMAWLPPQAEPIPNDENGMQKKSYGATTHGETRIMALKYPNASVVGIHPNFREGDIIERDFFYYSGNPEFPIHRTLEETCKATLARFESFLRGK